MNSDITKGHTADCKRFDDLHPWQCDCQSRASVSPSQIDPRIEIVAMALAGRDGLDFGEVCGFDATDGSGACDSPTCVSAHWEDHDAEAARAWYRAMARTAIAVLHPATPVSDWRDHIDVVTDALLPLFRQRMTARDRAFMQMEISSVISQALHPSRTQAVPL